MVQGGKCGSFALGVEARFCVEQWMACGLGLESREQWLAWARGLAVTPETGSSMTLPPLLRRRVTAMGQMALRASFDLSARPARFIFCSRHGEFQRTLNILLALAANEGVSPADFSLSVHNALAGLLSIARRNMAGHTTIAAGADSFRSGLIEATACLMERADEPVLLVYTDESLPEPYSEICEGDETCVALALLLTAPRPGHDHILLDLTTKRPKDLPESATGQAVAFLRFLLGSTGDQRLTDASAQSWRHA